MELRGSTVRAVLGLMAILVVASCASSLTMPEYADQIEQLVTVQNAQLDQLDAEFGESADLEGIKTYASERMAARRALVTGMEELDPPESAADLHDEALEILKRVTEAEAVLAAMVQESNSVASIGDLWATPEGVVARQADDRAILICEAAQETLDRTQAQEKFEDVPWIPTELKQVIRVAFGCRSEDR